MHNNVKDKNYVLSFSFQKKNVENANVINFDIIKYNFMSLASSLEVFVNNFTNWHFYSLDENRGHSKLF